MGELWFHARENFAGLFRRGVMGNNTFDLFGVRPPGFLRNRSASNHFMHQQVHAFRRPDQVF